MHNSLTHTTRTLSHRYVMCLLIVSTFAEVIFTIMDFQMKMMAKEYYPTKEEFSMFMGQFGQASNTVSLIFAITGTKAVVEYVCVCVFMCVCARMPVM